MEPGHSVPRRYRRATFQTFGVRTTTVDVWGRRFSPPRLILGFDSSVLVKHRGARTALCSGRSGRQPSGHRVTGLRLRCGVSRRSLLLRTAQPLSSSHCWPGASRRWGCVILMRSSRSARRGLCLPLAIGYRVTQVVAAPELRSFGALQEMEYQYPVSWSELTTLRIPCSPR